VNMIATAIREQYKGQKEDREVLGCVSIEADGWVYVNTDGGTKLQFERYVLDELLRRDRLLNK
jgi:hypothetical protein